MKKLAFVIALSLITLTIYSQNKARSLAEYASALINTGNHAEAIVVLTQGLENRKNCGELYNLRAIAKRNLRDFNGAMKDLKKANRKDPDYADAYHTRGVIYCFDYKQAGNSLEYFNKAINLDTANHIYWANRSLANIQLERYKTALIDIDIAIKVYSESTKGFVIKEIDKHDLMFYKATVLLGFKEFEKTRTLCTEILENDPKYLDAYYLRAFASYQLEDNAAACKDLRKLDKIGDIDSRTRDLMMETCQ